MMFKRGLLAVGICALLAGCGSDSGTTPAASADAAKPASEAVAAVSADTAAKNDYTYKIRKDEHNRDVKRVVEVDLSQRLTEAQLKELAQQIKNNDEHSYQKTFILFFVADHTTSAWATASFEPDLKVVILGSNAEEHKKIETVKPVAKGEVIGQWQANWGYEYKIVIEQENGKIFEKKWYSDGEIAKPVELVKRQKDGKTIYTEPDNERGEYYVINKNGDLEFWSNNGNYYTAPKSK